MTDDTGRPDPRRPDPARRATDDDLDRLLDGGPAVGDLGAVFSAAREPADADGLSGLAAASAALGTTPAATPQHARGSGRAGRVLRRLAAATVATKIALVTTAAVAIGGTIAVVEHRRHVPVPAPTRSGSPSRSAPAPSSTAPSSASSTSSSRSPSAPPSTPTSSISVSGSVTGSVTARPSTSARTTRTAAPTRTRTNGPDNAQGGNDYGQGDGGRRAGG